MRLPALRLLPPRPAGRAPSRRTARARSGNRRADPPGAGALSGHSRTDAQMPRTARFDQRAPGQAWQPGARSAAGPTRTPPRPLGAAPAVTRARPGILPVRARAARASCTQSTSPRLWRQPGQTTCRTGRGLSARACRAGARYIRWPEDPQTGIPRARDFYSRKRARAPWT